MLLKIFDLHAKFHFVGYKFIIIKGYYVIVQPFSNNCDLFSRIFEVFTKMEIKIHVINNKIFTKVYLKIRVSGKENSYLNISFSSRM